MKRKQTGTTHNVVRLLTTQIVLILGALTTEEHALAHPINLTLLVILAETYRINFYNMTITERLLKELQIQFEQENGSMTGGFVSLGKKIKKDPPPEVLTNQGNDDDKCMNSADWCKGSINNFCRNTRISFCKNSTDTGDCLTSAIP